ncbi:hypothetical protein M7I_5499 [Glarea lozoyensis 74030]|uniref:Uncharacterized protein n=1 Tax=Glarea lozoyensis (strain ATCC 74030 / MF5533) TaxID=1104152 RepID=H0ES24_GLAL7|nr:hypothetical protein M7I_5499 [Glarea lozoyensis 74030]
MEGRRGLTQPGDLIIGFQEIDWYAGSWGLIARVQIILFTRPFEASQLLHTSSLFKALSPYIVIQKDVNAEIAESWRI